MKIKTSKTQRGFVKGEFVDTYGNKCSIQKSSNMDTSIWLGIDKPKLTVFENESMGKYIVTELPRNWDVDSRMHLNQEQVKALIPILQNFVKTGEI